MTKKICIIGSGNWGSAVANITSRNALKIPIFSNKVRMWVYPENFNGESLIDIINTKHENAKYLPGISLPENLIADPDLVNCVKNADLLVFIMPHQFLDRTCSTIKPHIKKRAIAVSFIKGLFCSADLLELVSERIRRLLQIPVAVVSGANVANDVARKKFAEATLGYSPKEIGLADVKTLQQLFSEPSFMISVVEDVASVEAGGALKNIIALAAGFVDALEYGSNTKAAILRLGMMEMQKFSKEFFKGCKSETFWQSCGFADLITTCYAGRNRKCAEEFARTGEAWEQIEKRMLNGQKLQGPSTCQEVYEFLKAKSRLGDYPLFRQIYRVSFGEDGKKHAPSSVVDVFEKREDQEIVVVSKN